MSKEIYLNTGTSFQQPYIARVPANAQTPAVGQTPARQPLSGRTPFTYQNRAPATYSNPVSYRVPVVANATGTRPIEASSQTPYIAQARQPARATVGYQVPFTYDARYPARYIANGQQPFANSVSAQQPARYIANARQPHVNPVNAQQPFANPVNGQQPRANPVSAQQPFANPVNAQQPFANPVSAQQPFANPVSYGNPVSGSQTVPVFQQDIQTDYASVATSPYSTSYYSGYLLVSGTPAPILLYDVFDTSNSQAGGSYVFATTTTAALVSGYSYYGNSSSNYLANCYFTYNSSLPSNMYCIMTIANTAGNTYSSSGSGSILGIRWWLPTNWPRSATPDLTLTTASASINYSTTVTRFNGTTYVSDNAVQFMWTLSSTTYPMSVWTGQSSNAGYNASNGIYRLQLYDV